MAGVKGKGGVAGRSGPRTETPGVKLVRHTVHVLPEVKAALVARGAKWTRDALALAVEE